MWLLKKRDDHHSEWFTRALVTAGWILTILVLFAFWIHEGWFHLELFQVSEAMSRPPHNATVWSELGLFFHWQEAFDPNANRVRPLSEIVEVLDAVMRPLRMFGTHPSLTIISVVLAGGTLAGFYFALHRSGLPSLHAILLTFLLVTTVGYLSCFVPYIRPAKKLALVFTTLTLLFSTDYRRASRSLPLLWISVFCAFFCDEAGFTLWPLASLMIAPVMIKKRRWCSGLFWLFLPVAFAIAAKWIVPAIYRIANNPREPAPDAAAYLVTFLFTPKFYYLAAQDLASGVLISLGIAGPGRCELALTLAGFIGVIAYGLWRRRWRLVTAGLSLVAVSFSLSLFDMYNTPFRSSALGQLTYYYHSPIAVLTIFAVATLELRTLVLLPLVIVIGSSNLHNFYIINRALMIEHNYPLEARALPQAVYKPEQLAREYRELTPHFQGLNRDWFQSTFDYYTVHPLTNREYAQRYRALFAPRLGIHD